MADRPRISAVLCTHNGAAHLESQLRSILAQTRPVDELVISDDASTDGTRALLEAFAAQAPEGLDVLVEFREQALGVTANFEAAMARATGEVIVLCDQDDVWEPGKVEAFGAALGGSGLRLVFTDARLIDDSGSVLPGTLFGNLRVSAAERGAIASGRALDVLLRRNIVTGATAALRAELLAASTPFPASWVHDEWLAVTAAVLGAVELGPEPLTRYRLHGANQIGAPKLTRSTALSRFTQPRGPRNARLLERARALAERFEVDVAVPVQVRHALAEKLQHEIVRSDYPGSRVRRLLPILAEALRGRYRRYGLGVRDMVRDLVQPA
ncbi:glycosyltransferase [Leifsonia shinshuensis]|uniref:Glycosyltransferase n=1 Tax=Leifsonia shinshuensis TaxID=150026 RepID=A0A7G6Y9B8_9MICO|nr:glycosyltransferase [Leifsonia shinshuensis]QNE35083.1 glycosyltransferase [Leifsonia shinshuensis]